MYRIKRETFFREMGQRNQREFLSMEHLIFPNGELVLWQAYFDLFDKIYKLLQWFLCSYLIPATKHMIEQVLSF